MYKFYKDIIVSLRSCLTTTLPLPGPARWPDKTSRIRISATVAFLFIALMQVSATATAQTVTLVENKSRLATVLEKMRKQTGYDFMYSTATLRGANPVTISVKNVPLERVLTAIFESQPLQFSIEDRSVVISRKPAGKITEIVTHQVLHV